MPYFHAAGVETRLAVELLLHRLRLPVHRARVVGKRVDARPVDVLAGLFLLADGAVVGGARDRDAIQFVVADRLDGGVENRLRIDKARGELLLVATEPPIAASSPAKITGNANFLDILPPVGSRS